MLQNRMETVNVHKYVLYWQEKSIDGLFCNIAKKDLKIQDF